MNKSWKKKTQVSAYQVLESFSALSTTTTSQKDTQGASPVSGWRWLFEQQKHSASCTLNIFSLKASRHKFGFLDTGIHTTLELFIRETDWESQPNPQSFQGLCRRAVASQDPKMEDTRHCSQKSPEILQNQKLATWDRGQSVREHLEARWILGAHILSENHSDSGQKFWSRQNHSQADCTLSAGLWDCQSIRMAVPSSCL